MLQRLPRHLVAELDRRARRTSPRLTPNDILCSCCEPFRATDGCAASWLHPVASGRSPRRRATCEPHCHQKGPARPSLGGTAQAREILDRISARCTAAPLGRCFCPVVLGCRAQSCARARRWRRHGTQAEEASTARDKLRLVAERWGAKVQLWQLVSCARAKSGARLFFPKRAINALRTQWANGGHDSDAPPCEIVLLSAVVMPATTAAKDKHLDNSGNLTGNGFAPGPCTHF
jgi:hypothetical protein